MKRCIFVGPSLHGISERPEGIVFRPPAGMGDLMAAVQDGFEWIGLIDGYFSTCASVWHKEILYALSRGCLVSGAASMGALRAAECHWFGMHPLGAIAWQYVTGVLNDDADVALLHGPAEIDYAPFTEAMVDVRATLLSLRQVQAISDVELATLLAGAQSLYFCDRTVQAILDRAVLEPLRASDLARLFEKHRVRAKQADALQLVAEMQAGRPPTAATNAGWNLVSSPSLGRLMYR